MAEAVLNPQLSLTAVANHVTMRLFMKTNRRMRLHRKMMRRDLLTDYLRTTTLTLTPNGQRWRLQGLRYTTFEKLKKATSLDEAF
jgi:hypothetical protein